MSESLRLQTVKSRAARPALQVGGKTYAWSHLRVAALFLAPSLIIFGVFIYYALGFNIFLSTTSWNFLTPDFPSVGFDNYIRLFNDARFWRALGNTAVFAVGTISFSMALGLLLALMLNEKIPARGVLRTIFFSPYVTTTAAVALLWVWIFDPRYGLLNAALALVGIAGPRWLTDQNWSMTALIIMNVWKTLGYTMVIYLAGLQAIPRDLLEAAKIDGAGRWTMFRYITFPLLSPTTFFILVTTLLSAFQVFDQVAIMTQGGPVGSTIVLNYYVYEQAFVNLRAGYAATISTIFFLILLSITVIQVRLSRRWVHYQ